MSTTYRVFLYDDGGSDEGVVIWTEVGTIERDYGNPSASELGETFGVGHYLTIAAHSYGVTETQVGSKSSFFEVEPETIEDEPLPV